MKGKWFDWRSSRWIATAEVAKILVYFFVYICLQSSFMCLANLSASPNVVIGDTKTSILNRLIGLVLLLVVENVISSEF